MTSPIRARFFAQIADPHSKEPTMTTTDHADTEAAATPDSVTLSARGVAGLVELLDHCHAFLDTHQGVTVELDDYCTSQPAAVTSYWIIDQLSWHALLLRLQLAETGEGADHGEPGE
jgi:hypothetical protein